MPFNQQLPVLTGAQDVDADQIVTRLVLLLMPGRINGAGAPSDEIGVLMHALAVLVAKHLERGPPVQCILDFVPIDQPVARVVTHDHVDDIRNGIQGRLQGTDVQRRSIVVLTVPTGQYRLCQTVDPELDGGGEIEILLPVKAPGIDLALHRGCGQRLRNLDRPVEGSQFPKFRARTAAASTPLPSTRLGSKPSARKVEVTSMSGKVRPVKAIHESGHAQLQTLEKRSRPAGFLPIKAHY